MAPRTWSPSPLPLSLGRSRSRRRRRRPLPAARGASLRTSLRPVSSPTTARSCAGLPVVRRRCGGRCFQGRTGGRLAAMVAGARVHCRAAVSNRHSCQNDECWSRVSDAGVSRWRAAHGRDRCARSGCFAATRSLFRSGPTHRGTQRCSSAGHRADARVRCERSGYGLRQAVAAVASPSPCRLIRPAAPGLAASPSTGAAASEQRGCATGAPISLAAAPEPVGRLASAAPARPTLYWSCRSPRTHPGHIASGGVV